MKKTFGVLILSLLTVFLIGFAIQAAPEGTLYSDGNLQYVLNGGSATVCGYLESKSKTEYTVPDSLGGAPVNTIALGAFYATNLTKIYLPSSIEIIEDGAFVPKNGTSLKVVEDFGQGKTRTTVYTADAEGNITKQTTGIVLPPSDPSSGEGEEPSLHTDPFDVLDPKITYSTGDGFLFKKDLNGIAITGYSGDKTDITIPTMVNSVLPVTKISNGAFLLNTKVKTINIPYGIAVEENALGKQVVVLNCDTDEPFTIVPEEDSSEDYIEIDAEKEDDPIETDPEGNPVKKEPVPIDDIISKDGEVLDTPPQKDEPAGTDEMPFWGWILIGVGTVLLAGLAVLLINAGIRKKKIEKRRK